MKRQPARTKTIVGVLDNPDPRFVSLVNHGANQRPFHVVKRHQPPKEKGMPKQPEFKIHRVVFDPEHFADETAVKDHLTSRGYTDFTVQKNDKGQFYVEDTPADEFVGDLRTVESTAAKGVSYVAGDVKVEEDGEDGDEGTASKSAPEGDEGKADKSAGANPTTGTDASAPGAEKEPTSKNAKPGDAGAEGDDKEGQTPEPAAKAQPRTRTRQSLTVAGKSLASVVASHELVAEVMLDEDNATKSFAEMLSCYNGSMPPGVYDMADALMGSMRKMFSDGDVDEAKVSKLATDFAGGVMALYEVYAEIMANKAADGDDGDAFAAALLAMLFDAAEDNAAKADDAVSKEVEGLKAQMSMMQKTLDQFAIHALEGGGKPSTKAADADTGDKKSMTTTRTVKDRNSTDADEAADAANVAEDEATKEARKRAMGRAFGRYAAKNL